MQTRSLKFDVVSAFAAVIAHSVIWCAFFLVLLLVVPRAERTIRDFDIRVPELTVWMLNASHWMLEYYYLLPLVIVPALVIDGAVYLICRRNLRSRVLSVLWCVLMFIVALAAIGVLVLAVVLPGARVWQGLLK